MAKMSKKFVLALVILIAVGLSIGIWEPSLPPTPTLPQVDTPAQHTEPGWTFPGDNEPAISLPDFASVVTEVMPSVVSVFTEIVVIDFFGRQSREYGAGSGILIDSDGYIATNNHVIENAQTIHVELADGRTFPARVIGADPLSDLAVIKIDATNLTYAYWGDSNVLSVGEWVLAIGNALGEGVTATEGIVSRLNVSVSVEGTVLYGLVQTTAAINPGNSGGPLVNMFGEVIGITSVKIVAPGVEGMGFAISSSEAKPIIQNLIRYGRVTYPWLGVGLRTVEGGALIVQLVANSPADIAGLRVNDVIIHFGGQEIGNVVDLIRAIRTAEIGEDVEIVFVRGEDTRTTSARLIERPSP
jgi:serine protease Do